ncbi:aldose epimerase family protein [Tengunoibacter tsumagoiensis]|uniref:Aldose 1-epimerase n=1 Tax=Tengunoibacter tsumagoiensis TaxID=2014871 RepID=A0A401ZTQ9_9CHLR|nr:hypothetical protein [Tengunoibacter tsumagoiensis]GCE10154.1 hypothetical protein KTT_00130 [Tengunoibacter tsumagoiensis]
MAMQFPTAREQVLRSGETTIGVIPELSLVTHFQVGSWPVLYRPAQTGNVKRWGIPLMLPNFGRLPDGLFEEKGTTLPMHGFGRNLPWSVIQQDDRSIRFQLNDSAETQAVFPYAFTFTATIEAHEQTLTYTLVLENRSAEVMPLAPGFHPYFTVAQEEKSRLIVSGLNEFSPLEVEWATQPPDVHYPFPHSVTVTVPSYGTFTIAEQPVNGRYLLAEMQVWSEPAAAPDHDFVCFEPIVAHEGGINRPADRLNIAPHSSETIVWQLSAQPR